MNALAGHKHCNNINMIELIASQNTRGPIFGFNYDKHTRGKTADPGSIRLNLPIHLLHYQQQQLLLLLLLRRAPATATGQILTVRPCLNRSCKEWVPRVGSLRGNTCAKFLLCDDWGMFRRTRRQRGLQGGGFPRAPYTNSLMPYQNTTNNNNLDEDKYALTSSPPGVLEFSKPALFFGY